MRQLNSDGSAEWCAESATVLLVFPSVVLRKMQSHQQEILWQFRGELEKWVTEEGCLAPRKSVAYESKLNDIETLRC